MLEAMRILKQVYPNPKRTIVVGHWSGEEQGLNGSRAFAADHPEIVKGLQALFNQDNGTGRIVNFSASGFIDGERQFRAAGWRSIPAEMARSITSAFPGCAGRRRERQRVVRLLRRAGVRARLARAGTTATYTWHTNRDTFDKIVLDDLKNNATLTAMLVYLASEDPETLSRDERVFELGPNVASGGWPWRRGGRPADVAGLHRAAARLLAVSSLGDQ